MMSKTNINQCGWFYHAPSRRKESQEPVLAPITSQIPGLNNVPPEIDEKPQEIYFKETDTKFIRMAKLGGRKDLLEMQNLNGSSEHAVGYPKVDWYYLEDNAQEAAQDQQKAKWDFMLPEYMVHEIHERSPEEVDIDNGPFAGQVPYGREDKVSAFQRDGKYVTDKTVKLPEPRPAGYGVRFDRISNRRRGEPKPTNIKPLAPKRSMQPAQRKCEKDNRPIDMNKLLAHEYEKEWHSDRVKTKEQADRNWSNGTAKSTSSKHRMDRTPGETPKEKDEIKEPFIMSKFKNIPAKVDSHQKLESSKVEKQAA